MHGTLRGADLDRLERSCSGRDAIRFGASAPGLEQAEARFAAHAFAAHRHDTYGVGITLAGVQQFRYRGARRTALAGELHVLHPDELHDGGPGTPDGFAYRILYVEPELVREALGGGPLPFVAEPVQAARPATAALVEALQAIDEPVDDVRRSEIATAVADALRALAGGRPGGDAPPIDLGAVERVRAHLAAHAAEPTPAAELERIAGCDRYTLARHFRRALGTSPDRYRTMRRLERARAAIRDGVPLAAAAAGAGFADQSHLTRQFKLAYGLTPGAFAALSGEARAPYG